MSDDVLQTAKASAKQAAKDKEIAAKVSFKTTHELEDERIARE